MSGLFEDTDAAGLSPLIKWPGGKEREIKYILPRAPEKFVDYYEPFVGGGAVFAAIRARRYFINDRSAELAALYRCVAGADAEFFRCAELIAASWENMRRFVDRHLELIEWYAAFRNGELTEAAVTERLAEFLRRNRNGISAVLPAEFTWHREVFHGEVRANLIRKIKRMKTLEGQKHPLPASDVGDNLATAFFSALYMYCRRLYNDKKLALESPGLGSALFLFIRNYAFSGMFRYNDDGDFNVPYGGISYNGKSLTSQLAYYRSPALRERLAATVIADLDFADFFAQYPPGKEDFVFLDPPYDSDFSTYAQNAFSPDDQRRLAEFLIEKCPAKWMLVIKYTDFIHSLYSKRGLNISSFDKTYSVSFMNRNNKDVSHLLITNY